MAGTITVRPTPPGSDWWANDAPAQPAPKADWWQADSAFDDRFKGDATTQPPNKALAAALPRVAAEMTRGEPTSPAANMAIDAGNQLSAASQGTTPHIDSYNGRLLSTETFEDDGGNILFRDPQTGKVNLTDKSKHIALRDPADNTIKVFARDASTNENPAVGVARVLAPGLAAGGVTARPAIAAVPTALTKASDVFASAKAPYRAFDAVAAKTPIAADEAKNLVDRVQGAMDAAHLPSEVAKQAHDTVALIGKKGTDTTLSQLQYVKRAVGNLFKSPDENVRKGAAVAAKEITRIISEVSPEAGASLKTADEIHSTARSLQELQNKGAVADLRAGRAGYGGNAVNSMRQVLSPIVQRAVEGKMTGFKPDEITAMREIVEGTTVPDALRTAAQWAPSKGGLRTTSGMTVVLPALGSAANKIATIMTANQIERLKELVAKRSPAYAHAVAKSVNRFERAQMELANRPAPNTFAAYLTASRALSTGLTKDGIEVTSGQLLKQIAGQPPAQAEQEQPAVGGGGR